MDTNDLIAQWLEEDPSRPGASGARIVNYGVPVWALIGHLRAVELKPWLVAQDYDLPQEAIDAAIAYYEQNRIPIDARLMENVTRVVNPTPAA